MSFTKNLQTLFHYGRVVWYRIVKPFFWNVVYLPALHSKFFLFQWWRTVSILNLLPKKNDLFLANIRASLLSSPLSDLKRHYTNTGIGDSISQAADISEKHCFAIFSEEYREFGERINWFLDYHSCFDWSNTAIKKASTIPYLTGIKGVDIKYPWEINRCAWFVWLALGILMNDDKPEQQSRYSEQLQADFTSWIENNPTGYGINWVMPMEVALRAINWIYTLIILPEPERHLSGETLKNILNTLFYHGLYLEYNLEYVRNPGNHLDSNALGLIVLGAFFYDARRGKRWFHIGKKVLEREIQRQTYPDGVNYEKSTSYHRLVTEMFTLAVLVADNVGLPFSANFRSRLKVMYEFMAAYTKPDGTAPMFGDADDGRVLRLSPFENHQNHNINLALGAMIFQEPRWLFSVKNPPLEIGLFFGKKGIQTFQELLKTGQTTARPLELTAQQFPAGGYYLFRSALHQIPVWLMLDAGDYGMNGWGGHGHNDCLSFELYIGDTTFISDSGTGCYTANPTLRNSLRSTKAHNTIMLEEAEQVEFGSLWRIQNDTLHPTILFHQSGNTGVYVATHKGYKKRYSHKHQRIFFMDAEYNSLSISDELRADDSNIDIQPVQGIIHYIIPGSVFCQQISNNEVALQSQHHACRISSSNPMVLETTHISPSYNVLHPAHRLCIGITGAQKVHTTFIWRKL